MPKYVCLSIPEKLMQLVDEKLEKFAYSSKTDFVKQSIRRELQRLEKFDKKEQKA